MALGMLTPVDPEDPVGSKKRTTALSKELQTQFREKFSALRCHDLLQVKSVPEDATSAIKQFGLTKHCDIMIAAAVEIAEQILAKRD